MFSDLQEIQDKIKKQGEAFVNKRINGKPHEEEDFYIIQQTIRKMTNLEQTKTLQPKPAAVPQA